MRLFTSRLDTHPPEAIAVASEDDRGPLTYGALARVGPFPVAAGATVAFLIEPGRAFVETLLAIWRAGAIAVPLSPLHPPAELEHVIGDTTPTALIASSALTPRLAEAAPGSPIVMAGDLGVGFGRSIAAEDCGLMLHTSGTTGKPKGVRLSHRALAATVSSLAESWRWCPEDRLLHVLPLHHTHGLIVALLGALWAGAAVRFVPFGGTPLTAIWDELARASVFMAVPTIYAKMMEAFRAATPEERARWTGAARGLRLATSGSAALPAALFEEIRAQVGVTILERYGMTEIGMALSNPYDGPRVAGAVGRELPDVEIDLIGDDGQPVAADVPGELRVRSPQMFTGYHRDPDATAASFDAEGRFRTGDVGTRDADGVIRLLGRSSVDIIKSGGYKLSALEIEAALLEHPAIAEVAVIGVPDPTWGETVTACVVARTGATPPTLEELQLFARARLAPYKLPRALRLLPDLPRNSMGKVQKRALLGAA